MCHCPNAKKPLIEELEDRIARLEAMLATERNRQTEIEKRLRRPMSTTRTPRRTFAKKPPTIKRLREALRPSRKVTYQMAW